MLILAQYLEPFCFGIPSWQAAGRCDGDYGDDDDGDDGDDGGGGDGDGGGGDVLYSPSSSDDVDDPYNPSG